MIGQPAVVLALLAGLAGAGGAWQVQAWRWAEADAERVEKREPYEEPNGNSANVRFGSLAASRRQQSRTTPMAAQRLGP